MAYYDPTYGPPLAATQGFLTGYERYMRGAMMMKQLQLSEKRLNALEQYRQSLVDMNRERLDISREQLEVSRQRLQPKPADPFETYGEMLDLTRKGMPPELAMRGLASRGALTSFAPYSPEYLFPPETEITKPKDLTPSQRMDQLLLEHVQAMPAKEQAQWAHRELFGKPEPPPTKTIADELYEWTPQAGWSPTGIKGTELSDQQFERATTLRKEFNAAKAYQDFQTIQRSESSMKQAYQMSLNPTTESKVASDQALAVLFQKMLDPTSVVRESEYARTGEGVGVFRRIEGYLPKLMKGGLAISDTDRKALYDMAQKLLEEAKKTMNQHIERYEQLSKNYNVDPKLVLGNIQRFDMSKEQDVNEIPAEELAKIAGVELR